MIALLNSYRELSNKLDINEKSEIINKATEDIKEEATMYEEKYPSTIFIFKKLLDLKNDNTNNMTPGKDIDKIQDQIKKEVLTSKLPIRDIESKYIYMIITMNHDDIIKYVKSHFKNMLKDKLKSIEQYLRFNTKKQYELKYPILHEYCIINSIEEFNKLLSAEN